MSQIFLYAEVQASIPFENVPWRAMNPLMKKQAGLIRKTWLSGLETRSVGGIYEFDTIEHARQYVDNYLAAEARQVGGAGSLMTRIYDGAVTEAASRGMASPWLLPRPRGTTTGRVYLMNDMHWSVPFDSVPWKELNELLRAQPGLLTKQWLSGVATRSVAGFYEFDTKDNALRFVYGMFADECRKAGVTANIKLFDAHAVRDASVDMGSPYYA